MTPFVTRANERFLRAEVLAALGRDADPEFQQLVDAARQRLASLSRPD